MCLCFFLDMFFLVYVSYFNNVYDSWKWRIIFQGRSQLKVLMFVQTLRKYEDTAGVIWRCKSQNNRQHKWKRIKGQTMIYKTQPRKLKIEQHERRCSWRINSSCSTCGPCDVSLVKKTGHKSWMRKGPDYAHDNRNISVVMWDIDIP